MTINSKNFYQFTCAVWKEVDHIDLMREVNKKPHVYYLSESGSSYYTLEDKVYRVSNHFNYHVNTCSWLVQRKGETKPSTYEGATPLITVAKYADFTKKITLWVDGDTLPEDYPKILKNNGVYPEIWKEYRPRPPVPFTNELVDGKFGITYHLLPNKYMTLFTDEARITEQRLKTFESLKKNKVSFTYFNKTKTGKRVVGGVFENMKFLVETFRAIKFQYPREGEAKVRTIYLDKEKLKDVEIHESLDT
jgi:hypothetical protein